MSGPYVITLPVRGQPVPPIGFGLAVKNAIEDLDGRTLALENGAQMVIARGRRITNTANFTTTEIGVLRIDNVPVQSGKIYRISTSGLNMDASVAGDVATARFRVAYGATPGTIANTSSPQVGQVRFAQDNITQSNIAPGQSFYVATADGYISVLLSAARVAGTGNFVFWCSTAEILDMTVEYGGDDPGDTGVVI